MTRKQRAGVSNECVGSKHFETSDLILETGFPASLSGSEGVR